MSEIMERVFSYCEKILNGEIKACKKHIQAVKRFLRDYENCSKEDNPYYFDEEVVEDFYWFAREFRHTEGVLEGQQVELTDFQLFLVANIFGFKKKSNGARRFRKVYIQIARKNAKSQFLAIVAAFVTFLGDERQRAYIAGWTRDQSSEVYEAVRNGIESSELLKGKWREAYNTIQILRNRSVIIPLSKEARKTGDGKNPSVGIVDEYHAHETSEIYDVLVSGMVARKEPLMFIITTAGFNLSSPCYKEYQYVSKILDENSPIENDEYFVMICELDKGDDIKDESVWIKANPIVATYEEGIESLRSELKTALEMPEKMRTFLTKNMNIWVDMKDNGYMDMSKWADCGQDFDLSILEGLECVVGVDLSAKIDLTSVGFIFKKDGKYIVLGHSFMPEDTLNQKRRTDKVPYDLWVRQGWITETPGAVVDYNFIKSYIKNFEQKYNVKIREICADPWNATQFMQDMESEGYTVIEIRQGIQTLSGPTKDFREQVYSGNVIHNNNPVLTWALSNAVTKQDANENIMLDKSKSTERIDPIAAVINAHVRAMLKRETIDINKITEEYLNMMGW
jgi:phage terminase large subunit-like protein